FIDNEVDHPNLAMKWHNSIIALLYLFCTHLHAHKPETKINKADNFKASGQPTPATTVGSKPRFAPPKLPDGAYYAQYFPGPGSPADHGLVLSQSKKDSDELADKYDGQWSVEVPDSSAIEGDYALVMKSPAKHYAISAKLDRPFVFDQPDKQFVLQYDVKFQHGMECGGAYLKLLTDSPSLNLTEFTDRTAYTIMFGPDKCGSEHKLHFILRHRCPATGNVEEKHARKPQVDLSPYFNDKRTHLYTLVVSSDNSFQVYIDRVLVNNGSLLEDLQPPVNPPPDADDPTDQKPADWDDREKIPDPKAVRPADWDESQSEFIDDAQASVPAGWLLDEPPTVPDTTAKKPADWDDDIDGAWQPAHIDNPKCKDAPGCGPWTRPKVRNPLYRGQWTPPLVDNPAYRGAWRPRRIANADGFVDKQPWKFSPIGAIGFELWSVTEGVAFDNLLIVDRKPLADSFADQTWSIKRQAERQQDSALQAVFDAVRDATNDRPWIWAALLVGVVLPLVLLIAYCCCLRESSPSSKAAAAAARARRKKTDGDDDYDDEDDKDDDDDLVDDAAPAAAEADYYDDSDEPPELVDLDAPDDEPEAEPIGVEPSVTGPRQRTVGKA
ncbi:hypothetical protein BOX15_Mlig003079g1, partial [Macrostomum lignano]